MVYPIAVITVAVGILSFIMIYIIPKFQKIFADFQMRLPWMTEALMATSEWFVNYWYVLQLVPLAWRLLLKLIRLNKTGNYILDRIQLWIPVMGTIIDKTEVDSTIRTLA